MPLISVLMPMRNAEPYVGQAIDSILRQADVDLELIVIDDGSTDRSAEIVLGKNDPRIRLLPGQRAGISQAFNAALDAAGGEIVTRCDADDLYPANRLAWQSNWFKAHPDFVAVCARFATIDARGRTLAELDCGGNQPADITEELLAGQIRTHLCTFAFRTAALRQLSGCRSWFITAEDVDLQLRLASVGRVGFEPIGSYLYRVHGESITHSVANQQRRFFDDIARHFARQRQETGQDDLQRGKPPQPPAANESASKLDADEHAQSLLQGQAWTEHRAGHKRAALAIGFRLLKNNWHHWPSWRNLALLAMKRCPRSKE